MNLFGTGETRQLRELNTKTERVANPMVQAFLLGWFKTNYMVV